MKLHIESILYGAYLAINRCTKIVRESPNNGYNQAIVKAFEDLKAEIEKQETTKWN